MKPPAEDGSTTPQRRRFVFHHLPRTGGVSVTRSAELSGLTWQRGWEPGLDRDDFLAAWGGCEWLSSHYLFADYRPAPGDVYLSWIRDPVDMFYSGFRYWRANPVRGDEFPEPTLGFMRDVGRYRDAREYADQVLELRPAGAFPRGLFAGDWDRFDFVGITGRMAESLGALNERFGTDLRPVHVNHSAAVPTAYRRTELERLFSDEMAIYRSIEERFDDGSVPNLTYRQRRF